MKLLFPGNVLEIAKAQIEIALGGVVVKNADFVKKAAWHDECLINELSNT